MISNKLTIKHSFAYYLPQYHLIKENNQWWGEGFTEWVHLKNAISFHKNQVVHFPHSDIGFYDLTDIHVMEKQYDLARKNSIDTFCFWHYWFSDDDLLLEKPAELLLQSNIHVEFCFAWANHSWFNKAKGILLKEQRYDYSLEKHFHYLLPFFKDSRYRKIDNKPVFVIYDPLNCRNLVQLMDYFNVNIKKHGMDGIYWIFEKCNGDSPYRNMCDFYLNSNNFMRFRSTPRKLFDKVKSLFRRFGIKSPGYYDYVKCVEAFNSGVKPESHEIPIVFPGWDTTIRHGKGGICLLNNTPDAFKLHLKLVKRILAQRDSIDTRLVFIKSWNEWAEGNFIEPSSQYGYVYIELFGEFFSVESDAK